MSDRKLLFGSLGFLVCVSTSAPLLGAELVPYRLPSQENYQLQSAPPARQGVQQQSDSREQYYSDFERNAQGLSAGDRDKLLGEFSKKQQEALRNGKPDLAKHYFRLMEILSKEGKK